MAKYTIVWKKPGTRDALKEAGPFTSEAEAMKFVCFNQPLIVEAVRIEAHQPVKLVNEQCNELAVQALALGNYGDAMRWFNTAAARTIGHTKRGVYEAKAENAANLGTIEYRPHEYMER